MEQDERAIVIIEDDQDWIEILSSYLSKFSIIVLNEMSAVLQFLDDLETGVTNVVIAAVIIDGNLTKADTSNEDGYAIIARLRSMSLMRNVLILGNAALPLRGVDINLEKDFDMIKRLPSIITPAST